MPASAPPAATCPDTLSVEVRHLTPAWANLASAGVSVLAGAGLGGLAAVHPQAPVLLVAFIAGALVLLSLVGLAAGVRQWRALRDGRLDLAPATVTYSCRSFTRIIPADRVTAVRWLPVGGEIRIVGADGTVCIWVAAFEPAARDDVVTWVHNRWPQWLHHGWPAWAKRAAAVERVPNAPTLGRDRLAPPDPDDPPLPPPTPPTTRLDVRARPRAWLGYLASAGFFSLLLAGALTLAAGGARPRGAGDVLERVVFAVLVGACPGVLCGWSALRSRNGRLVLDPDWVIYSCSLSTRTLPAAEVTAVEWQPVLGRVRLRGADRVTVAITLDFFPPAKRYAILTWVRGRFPEEIQSKWDQFHARRFLPPTRRPARPETVLPFLYGRGFLKLVLVTASVSAVCGELFGLFVQRVMPPGQPFLVPLGNLGNRPLVLRDPEDWAVFCAAAGAGVTVLFLGAMRVLTDLGHWLSADREGGP